MARYRNALYCTVGLAWRVLRKNKGRRCPRTSLRGAFSPFTLALALLSTLLLRLHHRRHLNTYNKRRSECGTGENMWQNGSIRCQDMRCCEERCWHACHFFFFHVRPFTEHRQHHRAHATSCASTLLPRTKPTCEQRVMQKLGSASEARGHGHTKVSSIVWCCPDQSCTV